MSGTLAPERRRRAPLPNSYRVPGAAIVAGEYPGDRRAASARPKLRKLLDAGVTCFLDLTHSHELLPYQALVLEEAESRGLTVRYTRLPIVDNEVPTAEEMAAILGVLEANDRAGLTTYVHCWGGVGRTGTVVGCWFVRRGRTGPQALEEVAALFATMSEEKTHKHAAHGSPQSHAQREFVREWAGRDPARAQNQKRQGPSSAGQRKDATWPLRLFSPVPVLSRIRACLLGGAIGDALGWPVEFLSLRDIRAKYGSEGIQNFDPAAQGGLGAVTDDTQMTLFTAEGVLRSTTRKIEYWLQSYPPVWPGYHPPMPSSMWLAYRRWLRTQGVVRTDDSEYFGMPGGLEADRRLHARRAPGLTCISALEGGREGSVEEPRNNSKGCGGVMRVAPIGLVPCEDPFAYAVMAAALTHGHPSGYLSAGAYAQILSDLYFEQATLTAAVERTLARLANEKGHEETSAALRHALALASEPGEPTPERVERFGSGKTGEEALAIGVYCALVVSDDFAKGVRLAVNHSGDSDSTGSITGALLGVTFDEDRIPEEWLAQVELRDLIGQIATDLHIRYGGGPAWRKRYPCG